MVPTYNQERFVRTSIESAAGQDYDALEVMVSDDGSSDSTPGVIRECAAKYPGRVRALVGREHAGITANCNRALRACRGRYVAFSAGDDEYLPGKIARQAEWLEADPRRVLCFHDVEVYDDATGSRLYAWSDRFRLRSGEGPRELLVDGCIFPGVSIMVRRDALPAGGYDERLPVASDYKLWIDCLCAGGGYGPVPGILARLRRHPKAAMVDPDLSRQGLVDSLRTLELVEREHPDLSRLCRLGRATALTRLGGWHLLHGRSREARRYLAEAVRIRPLAGWRGYVSMALSLIPRPLLEEILAYLLPAAGRPDLRCHLDSPVGARRR
jgi:hypothetical protein